MTSGASAPIATPPWPPSHLYPLDTTRSGRQVLASHVIAPAPWVASRTSLTPACSVAARSRGTSITVPVAYWTHPTATTDVRASIRATTSAVRSDSGRSSTNSTRHSPRSARRSQGRVIAGKSVATAITFDPRRGDSKKGAWPNSSLALERIAMRKPSTINTRAARSRRPSRKATSSSSDMRRLPWRATRSSKVVHGVNGRVANQTQRGLVEIDAFLQCGVVGALDQR